MLIRSALIAVFVACLSSPVLAQEPTSTVTGSVVDSSNQPLSMEITQAVAMHDDAVALLGDRITAVDGAAVLEVAESLGLSAYDAEFIVAAEALRCDLYSLDREILAAVPELACCL